MVVILTATLAHDGVFFAGEKLSCTLTFTHQKSVATPQQGSTLNLDEEPLELKKPDDSLTTAFKGALSLTTTLRSAAGSLFGGSSNSSVTGSFSEPPKPKPMVHTLSRMRQTSEQMSSLRYNVRDREPSVGPDFEGVSMESIELPVNGNGNTNGDGNGNGNDNANGDVDGSLTLQLKPSDSKLIKDQDSPEKKEGLLSIVEDGKLVQETTVDEALDLDEDLKERQTDSRNSLSQIIEELAWGFAQTSGSFNVDPAYVRTSPFALLKQKIMYRPADTSQSVGGGGSFAPVESAAVPHTYPVLSTPPSILFCDLALGEGESKSYAYEIDLPSVLPPSHRGKVVKFVYKLIVGVQRVGQKMRSQIVTIPFRVISRTENGGSRFVYDALAPVIINKDEAVISEPSKITSVLKKTTHSSIAVSPTSSAMNLHEDAETTQQNVMMICQQSARVSYEICKNNEKVARVILPRSCFRLAETIPILIDYSASSIPCYQVSITLMSTESIELPYSTKPKPAIQQYTRKVHDEIHQFTLNSRRSMFHLCIPSNASCDFSTSFSSLNWAIKLEFITGHQGRFYGASTMYDGFQHQIGHAQVTVEPFDCVIPIKVYGGFKSLANNNKVYSFEIP